MLQEEEMGNQFLQIAHPSGELNWLGADEYLPLPSSCFEEASHAAFGKL